MPSIALYLPDIPYNVGSFIRLCACFGTTLHIIEPCGFPWDPKRLKATALDYLPLVAITRHSSFEAFEAWRAAEASKPRLVLLSTKASVPYTEFSFAPYDILLFGRESAGVPPEIHAKADARVTVPMPGNARSLNVAMAGAIVLGEAVRQMGKIG